MSSISESPAALAVIQREIDSLMADLTGIESIVVATIDGFDVASARRGPVDASRVAAMASSMSAIGDIVCHELGWRYNRSVTIDTVDGFAIVRRVQKGESVIIVAVLADASTVLAQVIYRVSQLSNKLTQS